MSDETIVLDPSEFATGRTELALDQEGLAVREVDWGESAVELALVRRAQGEIPSDRHLPNVAATFKLRVRSEGSTDLPTIAQKLQQKVGLFQREGGWVRRDFDTGAGFASSLVYRVYGISFQGLHGWMFSHREVDPEVQVQLIRGPIGYAADEEVLTDHSDTGDLIFTESDFKGTAPGIIRVTVDNDDTADWRGLAVALESRDYSADATAAPAFNCEDLTPLGGATLETLSGSHGTEVVEHASLSANWLAILSSEIDGTGHMSHTGPRRIWLRIYDPGSTAGEVELRLEWRKRGAARWTLNQIVPTPLIDNYAIVDLGSCALSDAVLGDEEWEWRVTARTTGTAGADINLDRVWVLPSEQLTFAARPIELGTSTEFEAWTAFDTESGAITGDTLDDGTNTWQGAGDADDFSASSGVATRTAVSDGGTRSDSRFAVTGSAATAAAAARVDFKTSSFGDVAGRPSFGVVARYVDTANHVVAYLASPGGASGLGGLNVVTEVAGSTSTIASAGNITVAVDTTYTLVLIVSAAGQVWAGLYGEATDSPLAQCSGSSSDLATGGALDDGKVGIDDWHPGTAAATRTYDNFAAWVPDTPALVTASRSIEARSDGMYAQDASDDVWGRVSDEGPLLYAPPSGLENRTARAIIVPSRGDFGQLPDSAADDAVSARVRYHAGHLFASEAAP